MTRLVRGLAGIAVAGVAAGVAVVPLLRSAASADRGAYAYLPLVLLIGWGFIGAGLVGWLRRPGNRTGALMTAVGFAWLLASLIGSDIPFVHTVSLFAGLLWSALVIHLVLAFPSGVLRTSAKRLVALAAYGVATVLQVPPLLFAEGAGITCQRCPRHLLLVESAPGLAAALITVQLVCALGVVLAGCALLIGDWRRATPPKRRARAPILWSGAASGLVAVASFATDLVGQDTVSRNIDWLYLSLFALVPFAFLVGLLRSRLNRVDAVSELVKSLAEVAGPERLHEALAEALGDRSLALAYWQPEQERYVDAGARPVELPAHGSGRAATPIELEGRVVAVIMHDASLSEETELVSVAGAVAALELHRQRLDAELRARIVELRASQARLVEAADLGRRGLERDLHDGAQQRLVSLLLELKLARRGAARRPVPDGSSIERALLNQIEAELAAALAELRALARGLLPPVLGDLGLTAAVEELSRRSAVPVELKELPERRLPERVELAAYFMVAEALTNAAKHAGASRASVRVADTDGWVLIEVSDNGVGGVDVAAGPGLKGLRDRVGALGGQLKLESPAGRGTTLRAEIPCA
jgi:signal transduction histidine kinase